MKVIVTESKLGVEYISDVISSCDQNGVECIVDDKAGDILYYDPKGAKFGNDKLLQNSDVSIFDALKDKELFANTMKDAQGDEFKQFAVQWNDLQKKGDEDEVFKTNHCNPIRGNFAEAQVSESSHPMWHERYTTARNHLAQACQYMQQAVYEDRDNPKFKAIYEKMYALLGKVDSQWDKNVKRGKKEGWLAKESLGEGLGDDPRDWSASEGEIEIVWTTSQYEDFGIFEGDTRTYVIDYDRVDDQEDLINEVCRLIGKEYPDLDFEVDDFEITNEKEFWDNRRGGKELADGCTEIEGIPDWATSYLVNGDDSGLSEEDKADVDRYVDDLASEGLALAHPIEGTENEFDRYPAFGKACATSTWIANEI